MKQKLLYYLLLIIFIITYTLFLFHLFISLFSPIYISSFNIQSEYFNLENIVYYLKLLFPLSSLLLSFILSILISKKSFIKKLILKITNIFIKNNNDNGNFNSEKNSNNLSLIIGKNLNNNLVYLNENALYQNILITGAIGTGKTTSTIYPFINKLLQYENISGLILDVKGNMENTISNICIENRKIDNLITIELNGKYKYNPLHKPNLKPYVISNRLISILTLFSNKNNTDTYWFDKAENLLTNFIKLIRLYNNGYVTFSELHKIINDKDYLQEKLNDIKDLFIENKLNANQKYDYNQILTYISTEYINLDSRVSSIILSEITRLTSLFVSDIEIENTFCPKQEAINFEGFENIFDNNNIVLLKMNIAEYQNLSKIIAAYLKLDFQSEVIKRENNINYPTFFICDEYQSYVTENDAFFYSLSREYKCINIISTQSYSSLLSTLNNENNLKVLIQSFINKIYLRNDDIYTNEYAQKLFGKEDKIKKNISISENANQTNFNYLLQNMQSKKSNISESISYNVLFDNIFDLKDFSQNLKSFEAICYLSNGTSMLNPQKIKLIPYFEGRNLIDKNKKE